MKKLLSMLFPAMFLFWGIISSARAQSGAHPVAAGKFDVRFTVKNVDCSVSPKTLTIAVQVRATSIADTFLMGDANYRFRFKTTQLRLLGTSPTFAPSLVSQENFSAKAPSSDFNYGFQNLNGSGEGPTEGIVSLNTFYSGSNQGAKLVGTSWMTVACIKFNVIAGNECFDLVWNDDKTFPVTGMNEVYDVTTTPAFEFKQANVAAGGYFGNVNACMNTYCSPILAVNDINITQINTAVGGQVLTNDTGTGLTVTTTPVTSPTNGTVVLNANGSYTYTPTNNFTGTDTFNYKVCDNLTPQKCDTALVSVTVLPNPPAGGVNAPPVAIPDVNQTNVGTPVSGNVLSNDFDPNAGQTLTASTTPVTNPTNGTVTIQPNGTYTYTPNAGFTGQDSFTYKVCDNASPQACSNATVTIDVTVDNNPTTANDKPIAGDDSGTTPKNTLLTSTLSSNDSDPNAGQTLTYTTTPISAPMNGTVTITPAGGYTYTPTTGYSGPDKFTYRVCDNGTPSLCDTATVYLTVSSAPNNLPLITPPSSTPTVTEDATTPITVCVTYSDADATDTHTPTVCGTNNGTTTIASTNPTTKQVCLSYKPNANFSGTDSICVKVCDNNGGCTTLKIPVTVTPVNDPPVLLPKQITMPEDSAAKTICLPITDPDLPSDSHTAGLCATPKAGSVATVLVNNVTREVCVSYKPAPNFVGQDTVCVRVCDAAGVCTNVLIPVVVTEVADSPVVTPTPQTVAEDSPITPLCLPITDPDKNDTHTVTVCGAAKNGTATPTVNNVTHQVCLNYKPNANYAGKDSVCLTICDSYGKCTNVTVPITVTPLPDAPTVVIPPFTMPEDSAAKTVCMPITDPDLGDTHTVTPCAAPKNGTATATVNNTTHTLCITYTPFTNFNGVDTVCVKVCDASNVCTDVKIPITVTSVNDKPLAINDVNLTNKATPVSGNVLTNDKDPDAGQILTVSTTSVSNPANGTVALGVNGAYTYTPNPLFVGTDSFRYRVCDNGSPSLCDTATVVIEVTDPVVIPGVNRNPVALNDNVTTPVGTPVTIAVKANDTDPDGNPLGNPTLVPTSGPTKGTAVVNPDGTVTYTPNPTATGTDTFKYVICDTGTPSKCDSATVTIELTPKTTGSGTPNEAPIAVDDSKQTTKNVPLSGTVATNDSDPNAGQTLTFTQLSNPTNGTITGFNPTTGAYTYTPNTNFIGTDQFTYKACDNGTPSLCSNATVYLTVTNANSTPPIIVPPTTPPTMPEDGSPLTICMNIIDPDAGDTHTVTPCGALNGTVTYSVNNTTTPHQVCATYTPNPNFSGTDSVCVKVCDNFGNCTTIKVPVKVTPVQDPPVVTPPAPTSVPEDGTTTVCFPITDPDANDTHTVSLCAAPKHGSSTVTVNNNATPHQVCVTYTPLPNYNGQDTVCVKICDAAGNCTTVNVPFVVTPVNDAPIAKNDLNTTPVGVPVMGNVLTNDSDPDGNSLTVSGPITGGTPTKGTVVIQPNGTYTYTPNAGASGTDTFKYQVCDNGTPSLCDTATVTITITQPLAPGTNLPPVANPDATATTKDKPVTINVLANDGDPEGTPLKNPTITTPPTKGTVVVNPDGTITYTPNPGTTGDDTFTYQVCDSGTPSTCSTATVTVTVNEPNNIVKNEPPVVTDDAKTLNKNSTITSSVSANDVDPGQILTFSNTSNPVNGTVTFLPNGTYTYIPNPGFVGNDSFTYKACDSGTPSMCTNATVYFTVLDPLVPQPANTLPVALDDNSATLKGVPVSIPVKANDTYTAGLLGNPAAVTNPANGTVIVNANGTMTYTPNSTFVGVDSYKYKVCDASNTAKCDTAVVTILVKDPATSVPVTINNPPIAIDDYKITVKSTPVTGSVAVNDADPDTGQVFIFTKLTNPTNGTVTFQPNGGYTYTPNANFVGTDMFTYQVCDNGSPILCASATAYITVLDQPCVTFDIKVLLEGPYNSSTGLMNTTLNQRGLLPGQTPVGTFAIPTTGGQPFNLAPFNYAGTEVMTAYASTVVDWVLVSLRSDSTLLGQVFRTAGLLHNDGKITFTNPCFVVPNGSYYVVVEHRNHMGVMSATKVPVTAGKITYDFTATQSYQLTNPPSFGQKAIGSKFVMFAGEGMKSTINDNYDINFKDSLLWKTLSGSFDVYLLSDFNLDADSNFMDNSLWKSNSGRFSGVLH
jgi:hypothetical protein